ncbi:endo-1,4-beta-xylanase [Pseudolysinimonas sp.]
MTRAVPAHRLGSAVVEVRTAGGPLADTEVAVEMRRHAFGFGNIGFELLDHANGVGMPGDDELARLWLDAFDLAILPFYWADFEPEEGRPRTARLRRAAEWFAAHDVRLKGHPLVWHTLAPEWLRGRPLEGVAERVAARVRREVGGFADVIGTWDLVNEAVIAPTFDNGDNAITPLAAELGGPGLIAYAAEHARAANPGVALHLNDFDLSHRYEELVERVLELGVPVAGIGLQTHMHQGYRGEERALEAADRFARFGIPLHFTETTLLSGDLMPEAIVDLNDYVRDDWRSTPEGEERQASELEVHYRTLFGHPAVASITYWGLADRGAWLGAPAGLVRLDGTAKPGYSVLRDLIRGEWWTPPTTLRTDHAGRVEVAGVKGRYRLTAPRVEQSFDLA